MGLGKDDDVDDEQYMFNDLNSIETKVKKLVAMESSINRFGDKMLNRGSNNLASNIEILLNSAHGFFELSTELKDLTQTTITWMDDLPGTDEFVKKHRGRIQNSIAHDQYGQVYCLSALRDIFYFLIDVCNNQEMPNLTLNC